MLDPITALGVAGNVVQFIDFGLKATSKAREIHRSADGALAENVDLEVVTADLGAVAGKFLARGLPMTGSDGLDDISRRCTKAAMELLAALEELKAWGQKSKVKSVRKALKAIWGKRRVENMKKRLEGFRNEMQFYVLVNLELDSDAEFTKQSERFDTLDIHAKAIFEAISKQQESAKVALQAESAKSDDRHVNTITAIVAKQEEIRIDISRKIDEVVIVNGESVQTLISSEGSRSDERRRETTETIVAKQDQIHTEVIETLQSLDSTARAAQESTRRELEQLKQAMAQIEQDMRRRDEELKESLQALSCARNKKERKALQERSNAVTVALFALIAMYESLQQMVTGVQTHAGEILASATVRLWGVKYEPLPETTAKRSLLDAIANGPVLIDNEAIHTDSPIEYLISFGPTFQSSACALCRTWDVEFCGIESIGLLEEAGGNGIQVDMALATTELCSLATLLDSSICETSSKLGIKHESPLMRMLWASFRPQRISNFRNTEYLNSLIIITTFLVECHNLSTAASIIMAVFGLHISLRIQKGKKSSRDSIEGTKLQHVLVWSTIGRIAGFQKAAKTTLSSRLQKWNLTGIPDVHSVEFAAEMETFLRWMNDRDTKVTFSFSLDPDDVTRSRAATLYAMVEYLISFGFPLQPPTFIIYPTGLRAVVAKSTDSTDYTPTSKELKYTRYLKSMGLAPDFSAVEGDSGSEDDDEEQDDI